MSEVVYVVPCFNEERRLLLTEFLALAQSPGVRLVFANDGSTDGTAEKLEELKRAGGGRISWFSLPRQSGKAEAVRQGLRKALELRPSYVGYLDADLSTPRGEALRLAEEVRRPGRSVVLASRVALLGRQIDRSPVRHVLGRVFATAASLAIALRVYDTQCGAKLFRITPALEAALEEPFLSKWAFDVELLGRLIHGAPGVPGIPVEEFAEIPLREWRDVAGSKLRPRHMARSALDLVRIARDLARRRERAALSPSAGADVSVG